MSLCAPKKKRCPAQGSVSKGGSGHLDGVLELREQSSEPCSAGCGIIDRGVERGDPGIFLKQVVPVVGDREEQPGGCHAGERRADLPAVDHLHDGREDILQPGEGGVIPGDGPGDNMVDKEIVNGYMLGQCLEIFVPEHGAGACQQIVRPCLDGIVIHVNPPTMGA